MPLLKKILRDRITPEEFKETMELVPLSETQIRDLLNRSSFEIDGYKTGIHGHKKQKNPATGKLEPAPHTPPTVAETLILDYLTEYPERLEPMLEIARNRIIED